MCPWCKYEEPSKNETREASIIVSYPYNYTHEIRRPLALNRAATRLFRTVSRIIEFVLGWGTQGKWVPRVERKELIGNI